METPLYTALKRHLEKGRAPFHTPGHKGDLRALPEDLLHLDFTELPDTDSLYEACGPIDAAEKAAARLFRSARTLFSAGGCSLCIQAMLRLACPRAGQTVLCGRNAHRSAVQTMALLGLTPVWAMPWDLEAMLSDSTRTFDACYVTSPDYYGRLLDIPALAALCRTRGIPLLVDNAHGTHLAFLEEDLHPLHLGASMTADSAHKTLNVLTGGAFLQIGDARFAGAAKEAMALFGSTSPSYLIMASLDYARAWFSAHPDAYRRVPAHVAHAAACAAARGIPNLSDDPARLTLETAAVGLSGEEAAACFRAHGVEPEMADQACVVCLCTPWNTARDYARLEEAISALPAGRAPLSPPPALPPIPPQRVPLREALLQESRLVPLQKAVGRIAARVVCPCPPGVPPVMPGEEITRDAAAFYEHSGIFALPVL